jgi:hypothetical protein
MNVLRRLQFQNCKPAAPSDAKQIEDAVFTAGIGEYLRVDKARVKLRVDTRDVFFNDRLQPATSLAPSRPQPPILRAARPFRKRRGHHPI